MLLRAILGLGLVFANLPPVDPQDGQSGSLALASSARHEPLPEHALMEKVREFCLDQPMDCMEIAGATGLAASAARLARPAPHPATPPSRDTLTQADRAILPAAHEVMVHGKPVSRSTHRMP